MFTSNGRVRLSNSSGKAGKYVCTQCHKPFDTIGRLREHKDECDNGSGVESGASPAVERFEEPCPVGVGSGPLGRE